ncbi:hypothetical protein OY671_012659, partial [Metschnikowia pulcherrima]
EAGRVDRYPPQAIGSRSDGRPVAGAVHQLADICVDSGQRPEPHHPAVPGRQNFAISAQGVYGARPKSATNRPTCRGHSKARLLSYAEG